MRNHDIELRIQSLLVPPSSGWGAGGFSVREMCRTPSPDQCFSVVLMKMHRLCAIAKPRHKKKLSSTFLVQPPDTLLGINAVSSEID